jgi:integrase
MNKVKSAVSMYAPLHRGGTIKKRKMSEKLYVDFYYFGIRITRTTGLDDTPQNRDEVRLLIDKIMKKIEERTFRFAETFPSASRKDKKLFTELEGKQFNPEPQHVIFGEYTKEWMERVLPTITSQSKLKLYESALNSRILPYFKQMNFYNITSLELQTFIKGMKKESGPRKGEPLSRQRIQNVFIPLSRIWEDAADQHRWNIRNPFETINRHLPAKRHIPNDKVFRYFEWMQFLLCIPAFYRPHAEFLVMTGLSASEIAGLQKKDVSERSIKVQRSIVLKHEKEHLKTNFRFRRIPMTESIKRILAQIQKQCPDSIHLFPMHDNSPFNSNSFRKIAWNKALNDSQITYKTPYSTRHTFCGWALTIGMNPMKLVNLMGHSSKEMVYQVYGDYVIDLEDDVDDIIRYFGVDFIIKPEKKLSPLLTHGVSFGVSRDNTPITY